MQEDIDKHILPKKKIKFKKNLVGSKKQNSTWVLIITIISFILSVSLMFISSEILQNVNNLIALWVVFFIVLIGIIFDIIGIAVTAADEAPFHAMAARKIFAAKRSILLIRNANKVSSFCNAVVGDICGIISGTASALIIVRVSANLSTYGSMLVSLIISGLVASITVGGKAIGKTFAMRNSNLIVYKVSIILQFISGKPEVRTKKVAKKHVN